MADEVTLPKAAMAEPGTRRSGGTKQTLVQRMAQARDRTVAARQQRIAEAAGTTNLPGLPGLPGLPDRQAPATLASAAVQAAPALHLAPAAPGHWQVRARPGEAVMLMPGQMHFGSEAASVRTLLGSCVAVTLWHPARRVGGMCHFLLPMRNRRGHEPREGRYGDEALEAMVEQLRAAGTEPGEYEAHLYGGADTMPECSGVKFDVGERNIEQGWRLIDRYGFQLQGVDVGEDVPRTVVLTLATGQVEMRRGSGIAPSHTLASRPPGPGGGRRS